MDVGRAISFVFDDPDWLKKILLGGLFSLIPLIGNFVVYGYMLEIVRQVYNGDDKPLPEWDDFGGYLVGGLVLFAGTMIWFLPVTALIICATTLILVAGGSVEETALSVGAVFAALGLYGLFFVIVMIWSVIFLPIISGRYAIERRFGAMFEFGAIMAEVRRTGATPLLLLFLTYLVAGFIGQLGIFICFVGVIFTSFYSILVMGHGAGQVYRLARGLPPFPVEPPRAMR